MRLKPTRAVLVGVAVALSYVILASLVYMPYWPWDQHHVIDCVCSDPVQEIWFLNWTKFAVLHGHNPLITHYLNAPSGANLALNTSFPLLGFLFIPVTSALGPVASYNLLLRLALASSAFSMYAVLGRYTKWRPAAYLGGLLYGFSPYMIGHSHRHLFLTFVPLLPLLIPVLDSWLVSSRANPWRAGALFGVLVGLESLISPEVALTVVMFLAVGLAVVAFRHRSEVRDRLGPFWRGLVASGVTMLVVAGIPAWLLLAGPFRPNGPIHEIASLDTYRGDFLSPLLGTHGELLTPHQMARYGNRYTNASITENGFYLGILLILLLLFLIVRTWRRSALVAGATVAGLVAFVIGLGKTLAVNGHEVVGHLPFNILIKLPVVQNIEPARLSLFVQMGAAIVLAVGLDHVREHGWRSRAGSTVTARRTWIVAAVGVLVLLPLVPRVPITRTGTTHTPPLFTSAAIKAVTPGTLALTFPYDLSPNNDPMMWQIASGMRFRILGGEVFVPASNGVSTFEARAPGPTDISDILMSGSFRQPDAPQINPDSPQRMAAYLKMFHIDVAFVDPTVDYAGPIADLITAAIGQPPQHTGGMLMWNHIQSVLK